MSGAANRRRGAVAERMVVNWLRDNGWPDARRYLSGDGRQPGDIDGIPGVVIEVKDVAKSAFPSWRLQAVEEAGPSRVPIVVRRTRGVRDVGLWPAQVPADELTARPAAFRMVECPRTDRWWVEWDFGELMGELR